MLETHLRSPVTRERLRAGPAADHVDAFADWLHSNGFTTTTINCQLRSLASWTDWMLAAGFTAQHFLAAFEACKEMLQREERVRYHRGPNCQSALKIDQGSASNFDQAMSAVCGVGNGRSCYRFR